LKEQKTAILAQEQVDIAPFIKADKEEIIERLGRIIQGLGTHCDSHFRKIRTDSEQSNEHIHGVYEILSNMWGWMQENEKERKAKEQGKGNAELEQEADKSCLNFRFFKIRKTTIVISILGLLVFILTTFCMKQQNDYSILNGEYYKKRIEIREIQAEVDSLKNAMTNQNVKKK
jgi:hypothetical protein